MAFIDDVKPWFETGDYPTQSQFYTFFGHLRWKDEPLGIDDITNLTQILNGLAVPVESYVTSADPHVYTLPQNYMLEKIVVMPIADCTLTLDVEAVEKVPATDVEAAEPQVITVDVLAIGASKNVTVNGVPAGSTLKFIRRRLTN